MSLKVGERRTYALTTDELMQAVTAYLSQHRGVYGVFKPSFEMSIDTTAKKLVAFEVTLERTG